MVTHIYVKTSRRPFYNLWQSLFGNWLSAVVNVFLKVVSCRRPVVNAFWSARGFGWSIKNHLPTKRSVEGFLCSLIGCQPFRDRSRTNCQLGREQYMQKCLFLDEKGNFPWTKVNAHTHRFPPLHSAIFWIAEELIQAALYLWPYWVLCL